MTITNDAKKRYIVDYLLKNGELAHPDFIQRLADPAQCNTLHALACSGADASAIIHPDVSFHSSHPEVQILFDYAQEGKKWTVNDFTAHFTSRFKQLEKILQTRQELGSATSISRIQGKQGRETVAIIGLIANKHVTKNNNILLEMEDRSGRIRVMISQSSPAYAQARDIVLDEVIGITGSPGKNIIFAQAIFLPDIPLGRERKTAPDEAYALVLSDPHVGSAQFMEKEFENFLSWINGRGDDDEARAIASKVKYIFIVGDLVDGLGIYPLQESELAITDIHEQYRVAAGYLSRIPKRIKIIICPGNHDALRLSEPQHALPQDIAKPLYELPNAIHVSSPSVVTIHQSADFAGFDVLLYHGYSYDYYGDTVESIRTSGRHISDRVELIMKFLLQRRHLAPSHSSTLYLPESEKDNLVIEHIPDFFISGHIHRTCVGEYRGTTVIAGSCFQTKTDFQERVGHEPNPGITPLINLQTREVKLLNFNCKGEQ